MIVTFFFFYKKLEYKAGQLDKEMKNTRKAEENQGSNCENTQSKPVRHTSGRSVGLIQAERKG